MDYKNILSSAVVLLAAGFLVHGYPAAQAEIGPMVANGSNPLVHATGTSSGVLFSAPSDQLIVISDLIITASGSNGWQPCVGSVELSTSSASLGYFRMTADNASNEGASHVGTIVSHAFAGGLPVPSGEQVSIAISGNCTVNYVVAGYYARQ